MQGRAGTTRTAARRASDISAENAVQCKFAEKEVFLTEFSVRFKNFSLRFELDCAVNIIAQQKLSYGNR